MPAQIPILDSHMHQWDVRNTPREASILVKLFGWNDAVLGGAANLLFPKSALRFVGKTDYVANDYLIEQYREEFGPLASRILGSVHVEASWKAKRHAAVVDETRWLEQVVDPQESTIRAIVGCAELDAPDLAAVLDSHAAASTRFRGIRDKLSSANSKKVMDWARSSSLMKDAAWRAGYSLLGQRGYSFDAWMYAHQIPDFIDLVKSVPVTPVVLCHLGTPTAVAGEFNGLGTTAGARERIEAQWKGSLTRLAEVSHVRFKISGLLMPPLGFGAEHRATPMTKDEFVDRVGPYIEWALDTFGIERCMFGSNFPMDKVSISYQALVAGLDELLESRTEAEKNLFYNGVAGNFYKVSDLIETALDATDQRIAPGASA